MHNQASQALRGGVLQSHDSGPCKTFAGLMRLNLSRDVPTVHCQVVDCCDQEYERMRQHDCITEVGEGHQNEHGACEEYAKSLDLPWRLHCMMQVQEHGW